MRCHSSFTKMITNDFEASYYHFYFIFSQTLCHLQNPLVNTDGIEEKGPTLTTETELEHSRDSFLTNEQTPEVDDEGPASQLEEAKETLEEDKQSSPETADGLSQPPGTFTGTILAYRQCRSL